MATRQTSSRNLKSIAGAAALSFGVLALFVNLDSLTAQLPSAISNPEEPLLLLPALGLSALHAVQAYTFDHAEFLSSLLRILVSFWPLILIVAGALLLRPRATKEICQQRFEGSNSAAFNRGDR